MLHTPAHHAPRRVGCCVKTARACMPAAPVFTAQRVQRRAGCCKGNRRNHAHSCAGRTCQPAPQLAIAIAVVSHGGRLRGSGLLGHAHTRRQVQTPRERASAAPTPHRRIVAQHQVSMHACACAWPCPEPTAWHRLAPTRRDGHHTVITSGLNCVLSRLSVTRARAPCCGAGACDATRSCAVQVWRARLPPKEGEAVRQAHCSAVPVAAVRASGAMLAARVPLNVAPAVRHRRTAACPCTMPTRATARWMPRTSTQRSARRLGRGPWY